jgi:hypothetical protein
MILCLGFVSERQFWGGNSRRGREGIVFLFQEAELKYLSIYAGLINFTLYLASVISELRVLFSDKKRISIKNQNAERN